MSLPVVRGPTAGHPFRCPRLDGVSQQQDPQDQPKPQWKSKHMASFLGAKQAPAGPGEVAVGTRENEIKLPRGRPESCSLLLKSTASIKPC